jgi:replicative DNA helicase
MGIEQSVYTPVQVGEYALAEVRACLQGGGHGVELGFGTMATPVVPLRPGNLCVVQAYTSHYKTGFMTNWCRRVAEELKKDESAEGMKRIVVYVSWEDTVEDIGLFDLAHDTAIDATEIRAGKITDEAVKRLEAAAFRRGAVPVWIIGNSHANRRKQARLTLSQVTDALGWVEQKMGFTTAFIALDYLNLIQPEKEWQSSDGRRTDLMELVFRSRDLGMAQGCPVVLGAQSRREVLDRVWKLPQTRDALETSAIEQYCQLMLSLWRPALTEQEGITLVGASGKAIDPPLKVTQNLLIMGVNKQKRGEAGGWLPLWVDPARNVIQRMDPKAAEPEPIPF